MSEPEIDLSAPELRVLEAVRAGFPATWAPYCDMGGLIGQSEIDVLNTVLKLRAVGAIPRVGAAFGRPLEGQTDADRELMFLLFDIPAGEHPFDEIHEQLEFRGVDVSREWVTDRINEWIASGVISRFGVLPAEQPEA